jgi:hypothetical protein
MSLNKIYVALVLAGFATGAGAQTGLLQPLASDAGIAGVQGGGLQLAQTYGGQGMGPGGQGMGPGGGQGMGPGGGQGMGPGGQGMGPGGQGMGPGGQGGSGGRGRRRGPPPEAIAACNGKASGAACTFTGRRGETLTGTCFAPSRRAASGTGAAAGGPPLACRPARGAGGGR